MGTDNLLEGTVVKTVISSEFSPDLLARSIEVASGFAWRVLSEVQVSTASGVEEEPFSFETIESGEPTTETTSERVRLLSPLEGHDGAIKTKVQRYRDTVSAYKKRIRILKEQAELDGYSLNQPSKAAFLEFLEKNPLVGRGRLVLMENGNLRAVWEGENGARIGLQFLNNRSIQYVIFKQRETSAPVSRVYGRDTMKGISKQIDAFDLDDVLYT